MIVASSSKNEHERLGAASMGDRQAAVSHENIARISAIKHFARPSAVVIENGM